MARAQTQTIIPLDRVAKYLSIDPYHFNSIYSEYHPYITACDDDWYQYGWQRSGKISREEMADALAEAESKTVRYLGWYPIPVWLEDEVELPKHYKTEVYSWRNAQGQPKSLIAPWGYFIEPGSKALSLVDTPATVYSDEDGDGYNETTTIVFATTVTDEEELHVFFAGKSGRPEWEIRPLTSIVIAAGVATITFPKYLVPLPELWEAQPYPADPHIGIDGDVEANFVTEVDVYRVYSDPSDQCTFYADPTYCNGDCDTLTETGCLYSRNSTESILAYRRADWDGTSFTIKSFSYMPYKAIIKYRAGYRDIRKEYPDLQMREDLEKAIVYYALTLLDTEMCGCTNTRNIWEKAVIDKAKSDGTTSYNLPWNSLDNPFGTTEAAFRLLKLCERLRNLKSPYPA